MADRRPQVGRKENIRILMPRRDDEGMDGNRSYGFVVVPCVRRNFPQRRRLSVRGDATRRDAPRPDRIAPAHTCVYAIVPAHPRPPALPFRIRNRTFPRYLRQDITRSLLRRDGIFKWHAHWPSRRLTSRRIACARLVPSHPVPSRLAFSL